MNNKYILLVALILLIILVLILVYLSQSLKRTFKKELHKAFELNPAEKNILTNDDLKHLPEPVQKYLNYVGVVGKEKVANVKVVADMEMKLDPNSNWQKNHVEQYNFFGDHLTRLFYLSLKMFGIPVIGLHSYTDEKARMLIKLAGIIPVVDVNGPETRISDTLTLLNDMCLFAPATLIDERIQWKPIDDLSVKAIFNTKHCQVSAVLYFNNQGELINFITNERYYLMPDGTSKKFRWSTPLKNYQELNGLRLATFGEAIWDLPEGDYCYFKFDGIKEIVYNNKQK